MTLAICSCNIAGSGILLPTGGGGNGKGDVILGLDAVVAVVVVIVAAGVVVMELCSSACCTARSIVALACTNTGHCSGDAFMVNAAFSESSRWIFSKPHASNTAVLFDT